MKLRQSYIITSSDISVAYNKALEIARQAVASSKVQHPDIISIYKSKTELTVDQVRDVIADSIILPNEADYKVYIFVDGDFMNERAQNAALKLIEEPPSSVIIILCATKANVFLPTIRSRCVELSSNSDVNIVNSLAEEFIQVLCAKNVLARYSWLEDHNKMSIAEATDFIVASCSIVTDILCGRRPAVSLTRDELLSLTELFEKCLEYLSVNVTVKQVFGLLEIF